MGNNVFEQRIGPDSKVVVQMVEGDLSVEGTGGDLLRIEGDSAEMHANGDGHIYLVRCEGDCHIEIPASVALTIEQVEGDLSVENLTAPLAVQQVDSDVRLNSVAGPVVLGGVGSDLQVRDINGPLTIESVGSDARIVGINGPVVVSGDIGSDLVARDINGPLTVESVGSDLEVKRISGPVNVESVGSDATFREVNGPLQVGSIGSDAVLTDINGPIHIGSVGSDLVFDMPLNEGAPAHIGSVESDVLGKIRGGTRARIVIPEEVEKSIRVPGAKVVNRDEISLILLGGADEHGTAFQFDSIGGSFELVQGKSSGLEFDFDFDRLIPENLEEMISERINQQMARLQEHLQRQSENLGRAAERARKRAESHAQRAREQMEREKPKGKRRFMFGIDFPEPPMPPAPPMPPEAPMPPRRPVEPVTDQERLAILRMVEGKQITVEEAERLLAALEGRM